MAAQRAVPVRAERCRRLDGELSPAPVAVVRGESTWLSSNGDRVMLSPNEDSITVAVVSSGGGGGSCRSPAGGRGGERLTLLDDALR